MICSVPGCETQTPVSVKSIPTNKIEVFAKVAEFSSGAVTYTFADRHCETHGGSRLVVIEPANLEGWEIWIYQNGTNDVDARLKIIGERLRFEIDKDLINPDSDSEFEIFSDSLKNVR